MCVCATLHHQGFIKDTFIKYGCTNEDAALCADVLISSDKRGIDSHGIGRLKPIYCDRCDQCISCARSLSLPSPRAPIASPRKPTCASHCLTSSRLTLTLALPSTFIFTL